MGQRRFIPGKQWLVIILVADFIAVVTIVGPLADRYPSPTSTTLSIAALVIFVCCLLLLGRTKDARSNKAEREGREGRE
jgi:hypothetical protein